MTFAIRLGFLVVRRASSAAELFPKVLPHSLRVLDKLTENQSAKAVERLLPESPKILIESRFGV